MDELSIIIIINYNLYKHNDLSSQYFHFDEESRHRYSNICINCILVKEHLVSSPLTILQSLDSLPLLSKHAN
ncbi:hypothetical protein MKW98_009731 [Papaver atlanticum]|uniref:Uncharacterized protein n=1 Tax=Papaver atlanticum TaxID=357466 RepID=A0AAD4XLY3_9MAGN|nr:hypothetical protein MKW98_009731 [Papaver atlanticum]